VLARIRMPVWRLEYLPVPWFVWFAIALSAWVIASGVLALAFARMMARAVSQGTELLEAPFGANSSTAVHRPAGAAARKPVKPIAHSG